jgi:hypothetical protein
MTSMMHLCLGTAELEWASGGLLSLARLPKQTFCLALKSTLGLLRSISQAVVESGQVFRGPKFFFYGF